MEELIQYLTEYRIAKCITKSQMAEHLGVRINTYYRWERGEHIPTQENLDKVNQILGTDFHRQQGYGYKKGVAQGEHAKSEKKKKKKPIKTIEQFNKSQKRKGLSYGGMKLNKEKKPKVNKWWENYVTTYDVYSAIGKA